MILNLGLSGRLMILALGGFAVILAVVIVACFVGPGCWGFEYLRREEKKKQIEKTPESVLSLEVSKNSNNKMGYHLYMNDDEYTVYQIGPRGYEEKVDKANETSLYFSKERAFNLKCAPLLTQSGLYCTLKESPPKLEIKLTYSEQSQDEPRLGVHLMSASFLRFREYTTSLDPSILLQILNNKWSLQKNERIVHTVQTKVAKNTTNPTFDETYYFDVKNIDIKNWCLKLTVIDNDRLTKPTPLFENRVYLREIKNLTAQGEVPLSLDLQEATYNIGSLLFGISYLPTAQRLNINIVKAFKLKYQTVVQSLADFYPYVRVIMINNHGKCLKKKKTNIKHGDDNPQFNQSLIFDLSISNLEQTVFLFLLCSKSVPNITNSDDSSVEGDIETSLKNSKDRVLGTVVLGRNVRCNQARDHWVSVMQNPRKMISSTHDLR